MEQLLRVQAVVAASRTVHPLVRSPTGGCPSGAPDRALDCALAYYMSSMVLG